MIRNFYVNHKIINTAKSIQSLLLKLKVLIKVLIVERRNGFHFSNVYEFCFDKNYRFSYFDKRLVHTSIASVNI